MEATLSETTDFIQMRPLLRSKKFYIKAQNGECASCGGRGCCTPQLPFEKNDFQMDFSSEEDVRALFEIGIFRIFTSIYGTSSHAVIYIMGARHEDFDACIFWADKGCRLEHGVRPRVCRLHNCGSLKSFISVNVRERKRKRTSSGKENLYSLNEIKIIDKLRREYNNSSSFKDDYVNLDWNKILTILQGHP
jgi:hypothetical protein